MNKKAEKLNLVIFNILLLKFSISYIIYPFKTRMPQIEESESNITLLFRSLIDNNIYINIEMGQPKQVIDVFLRTDVEEFYFSEKVKSDINTNSSNPLIFDVNSNINNFFNARKSISLEISNKSITYYKACRHQGIFSTDILYFEANNLFNEDNDENDYIKKRISFILYNTTVGNMPGVLGLQAPKFKEKKEYCFIEQLKYNDIINSYFWMINYTSEYEGNLIIGEQPHILDKLNFKEEELEMAHPFLYSSNIDWGLRFDDIYFCQTKIDAEKYCSLNIEMNYILGNTLLEKELDKYFNEFIQNDTCFKEDIQYPYFPHIFYYCNKNIYEKNIIYFPSLQFYHNELNTIFKLDYKDLFVEKHDKLILMIFFDKMNMGWHLGKPFLKKYSFLMNQDTKLLGFYNKRIINNKNNDDYNYITIIKIVIIILGIIILFILGIFIGKYFNKRKEKPLNIIDEDFEYQSENKDFLYNSKE